MVKHASKQVDRGSHTVHTTLCGRMNKQSRDGMNIADNDAGVTCKFCLRILSRRHRGNGWCRMTSQALNRPVDVLPSDYWYSRRDTLRSGMVFRDITGDTVKLDRPVPGDGSKWYVADWSNGGWAYYDTTIEPSDLVELIHGFGGDV